MAFSSYTLAVMALEPDDTFQLLGITYTVTVSEPWSDYWWYIEATAEVLGDLSTVRLQLPNNQHVDARKGR